MSKQLLPEEIGGLLANAPPAVLRVFLDRQCHQDFEMFCRQGWAILNPGKPYPAASYIRAMIHAIAPLVTGNLKRMCNNIPPRHGKTEFGTIMLAAWILGRDPAAKVWVVSYGLELSEGFTAKIRQIMKHPIYKRIFPRTRIKPGQDRAGHFHTTAGGECLAASQGSAVTGRGTHFMLVDDFQKADEALSPVERENAITSFRNTMLSRFDNLGDGRILINQQRLHEDDLSGWALGMGWPQFKLPAIAIENTDYPLPDGSVWHRKKGDLLDPDRVTQAYLDDQREAQGIAFFEAQWQQNPGASSRGVVDWNWFGQYDEMPPRNQIQYVVQSVDPAMSPEISRSWSVIMTWGFDGTNWLLFDIVRVRLRIGPLTDRICFEHKRWRANALIIEGGSIGDGIYDEVKDKRRLPGRITAPKPRYSKEERLDMGTGQLETGKFLVPAKAEFLEDFRKELLGFPDTKYNDQVDALSQFLAELKQMGGRFEAPRDENGKILRPMRRPRRLRRYEPDGEPDDD